ncbi:hypothetical protein ACB098_M001900 [Castanea mollissima]
MQLTEDYKWIDFFDFYWRLGIDGLSIGPILLTGFITTLATLAAWPVTRDSRLFHFLMLAINACIQLQSLFCTLREAPFFYYWEFLGIANQSYPVALEIIFYIGFLIAFAVKSPIIPFHTWLPDTHGEAHYSTSYGLVRINMEFLPRAHSIFAPWLMIVGTIQIIYAASASPGQRNLKKRIAYSSVSHMGFIIIGIGSLSDMGLNGAFLQIISHGFIGAALFFLAGTSYDRIRLVYLDEMGGMAVPVPKIFTTFSILSMASLALPGMSGFVAELIVFFGIITRTILTPIYSLSMLRQMFYGYKFFNAPNSYFFDSGPRELFISISIFLPVIGIGLYPDFVFSLSVDKKTKKKYFFFS